MKVQSLFILKSVVFRRSFSAFPITAIVEPLALLRGDFSHYHFPIHFKNSKEFPFKTVDPVIQTGSPNRLLLSDELITYLKSNQLSGFKTFQVKVYDCDDQEISGYQGFSVIGRVGEIDYSQSTKFEKKFVDDGPKVKMLRGLFPTNPDDLSDISIPRTTNFLFCTEKFKNAISTHSKFRDYFKFISIDEYEILSSSVVPQNTQKKFLGLF
jgi:hypothetical protein